MLKAGGLFFYRWLRRPLRVGSVLPSSRIFGRSVASYVCDVIEPQGYVIDVGAGTGSFSRALLNGGLSPNRLVLIEKDSTLASFLRKHFPHLTLWQDDAANVRRLISHHRIAPVNFILSGLPLPSIPWRKRYRILLTIRRSLQDGGYYGQLSYLPFLCIGGKLLQRIGLKVTGRVFAFWNVPPGSVWILTACPPVARERQAS